MPGKKNFLSDCSIKTRVSPTDRQAHLTFITSRDCPLPATHIPNQSILLDHRENHDKHYFIYLSQPEVEPYLEIEITDKFPNHVQFLRDKTQKALQNKNTPYQSQRLTSTLFFKDEGDIIAYGSQDLGMHILNINPELEKKLKTSFGLNDEDISYLKSLKNTDKYKNMCIREMIKHEHAKLSNPGIIQGSNYYEICTGCTSINHGEPNAIKDAETKNVVNELPGANALIYNHWWSCTHCRTKMTNLGIKKIYLDKDWIWEYLQVNKMIEEVKD